MTRALFHMLGIDVFMYIYIYIIYKRDGSTIGKVQYIYIYVVCVMVPTRLEIRRVKAHPKFP